MLSLTEPVQSHLHDKVLTQFGRGEWWELFSNFGKRTLPQMNLFLVRKSINPCPSLFGLSQWYTALTDSDVVLGVCVESTSFERRICPHPNNYIVISSQLAYASCFRLVQLRRMQQYNPVNGCSKPTPISQILALSLQVVILILVANLLPAVVHIAHPALAALVGFDIFALIVVAVLYLILLLRDPADPRLTGEPDFPHQQTVWCKECKANVGVSSYHCQTCDRCVGGFDHHCVFLNNCIGRKNYTLFMALLVSMILRCGFSIGVAVWVGIEMSDAIRWVAVAYGVLSGLVLIQIAFLAIFHTYITFFLLKTTLQILRGDKVAQSEVPHMKGMTNRTKIEESTRIVVRPHSSAIKSETPLKIQTLND